MTINVNDLLFLGCGGCVYALSKSNGSTVWTTPLTGAGWYRPMLLPIPARNVLLVACGVSLCCLDAHTGQELWNNELFGMGLGHASVLAPPQAAVGRLPPMPVPRTGGKSAASVDVNDLVLVGNGAHIRAVQASTGKDVWEYHPGDLSKGAVASQLVDNGVLYLAQSGRVTALRLQSGREIWSTVPGWWKTSVLASMAAGAGETNRTAALNVIKEKFDEDARQSRSDD
ncbi:hypothetical protein HDU96_006068 [Phlyctochytrium bullatum]|nr:hypothetical protein HDU96_006068 [Phlyctochytrium bullatum]